MNYGETHKTWLVELDEKEYSFRFEHQFWTGEKKYFINNELIEHIQGGLMQSASFANDVTFTIGSHKGKFTHRAIGRATFNELFIDENKIQGEEKSALRFPLWVFVLLLIGLVSIGFISISK